MQRLLTAALVATGAAAATPALAQDDWYLRADLGASVGGALESPAEISFSPQFGGDGSSESGVAASAALGRRFGALRVEAELAHRGNDLERSDGVGAGEASATSLFINAYVDLNMDGIFRPYIGVGVGAVQIDGRVFNNAITEPDLVGYDDRITAAGYQAMAGVGVALTDRTSLDVGYRYVSAPDLQFDGRGPLAVRRSFDADYTHHGAFAGLRRSF